LSNERRIVLTGGEGRLARVAARAFAEEGWDVLALSHAMLDVTDRDAVVETVAAIRPDVVLNLAAWTDVARCERDPQGALDVNGTGVRNVADACRSAGAHLCHVSSDYVFSGTKTTGPYVETDAVAPLSSYGTSKRAGELFVGHDATLVRTAWLSGPFGTNVVRAVLDQAADPDRELVFVDDQRGSPTVADDLIRIVMLLVSERVRGVFHVTNQGSASWFEIARLVLESAGEDPSRVRPGPCAEIEPQLANLRPRYSVLDNAALRRTSIQQPPPWEASFDRLVQELTGAQRARTAI